MLFLIHNSQACLSVNSIDFTFYIASDNNDWVVGRTLISGGSAVSTTNHEDCTAKIPGAIWIWDSILETEPCSALFSKHFFVPVIPYSATLYISSDDSHIVTINGIHANCDSFTSLSCRIGYEIICDVLNLINPGLNLLEIYANTIAGPASLLYKLEIKSKIS
ncbi:hypothetical protein SteCoe_28692 [Stentor coeruleus]|uniref:Fucolectin tachylectin-4 pentraxin-1 domain-containing protein n=1 Tax=Stentor coeruleus TaxID=5963 RepID=A0A1R2B7J8_9CILI|nr:hypothetical protein SteCoe_28692 [Stentor coeruleus]